MSRLYDPLASTLRMPRIGRLALSPQRAATQQATDEELREAKRSLGSQVMGLGTGLFNVLDLPASMVRDVVSGQNPFDQLLSPLTQRNRESFIPEEAGLNDPRFYGALAAEIALDPLTYLTLGASALTKTGKVAKQVGALDDLLKGSKHAGRRRQTLMRTTVGDLPETAQKQIATRLGTTTDALAGEQLGTFARLGAGPLGGINFGRGERSLAAARGLDVAFQAARDNPVGRAAHTLFNPLVRGFSDLTGQRVAGDVTRAQRAGERTARAVTSKFHRAVSDLGLSGEERKALVRRLGEGVADLSTVPQGVRQAYEEVFEHLDRARKESNALGGAVPELTDEAGIRYFPRRATFQKGSRAQRGEQEAIRKAAFGADKAMNPAEIRRVAPLRNITGGTEQARDIIRDPELNDLILGGADKDMVAARLAEKYGDVVPESFTTSEGNVVNQREALADLMTKLTPEERAVGLFGNDPAFDLQLYAEHVESVLATQKESLRWVAELAGEGDPHETVGELLTGIGLRHGAKADQQGSLDALASLMGRDPSEIKDLTVTKELSDAVRGLNKAHLDPPTAKRLASYMDSFTNWFKANVTVPWPSFHTRNLYGGQFVNAVSGFYGSPANWTRGLRTFREVNQFALGNRDTLSMAKDLPAVQEELARRGLTVNDKNATDVVMEMEFADDVTHREPLSVAQQLELERGVPGAATGASDAADLSVAPVRTRGVTLLGERNFPTRGQIARTFAGLEPGTTLNPLRSSTRGVSGRQVTTFGPTAAGEQLTGRVELLNRLTPYIELQRQGYAPHKAAEMVRAAQIDYSARNFTEFERNVMKRAFPFYSWQSRMIPFTVRSMIERPQLRGVVRSQERATEQQAEFVPDKYRRQPTVLVGGPNELGYQQVLSGIDLAHNAALEPFQFGPTLGGTIERTGRGLFGNMHPLLRYGIEQGTGTSLFTGRNTEELEGGISTVISNIGELAGVEGGTPKVPQPIDNALLSIGLSRAVAPLRNITDPRNTLDVNLGKTAANFLTGARVSTYDPLQATASALGENLRETGLAGRDLREFSRLYIPSSRRPFVSPEIELGLRVKNRAEEEARAARERRDALTAQRVQEQAQEATAP